MKILKSDSNSLELAVAALKKNEAVILPTDTIYGFSGIVPHTEAKIRAIKGRGETKPFIQLVAKPQDIFNFSNTHIPQKLLELMPCELTVIVELLLGGTCAFRCPKDEWLRAVISQCGSPLYSTSVNRSGFAPLQKIADITKEFEAEVALIVDSGDTENALASTIVDLTQNKCKIIRQGAVHLKIMEEV